MSFCEYPKFNEGVDGSQKERLDTWSLLSSLAFVSGSESEDETTSPRGSGACERDDLFRTPGSISGEQHFPSNGARRPWLPDFGMNHQRPIFHRGHFARTEALFLHQAQFNKGMASLEEGLQNHEFRIEIERGSRLRANEFDTAHPRGKTHLCEGPQPLRGGLWEDSQRSGPNIRRLILQLLLFEQCLLPQWRSPFTRNHACRIKTMCEIKMLCGMS